MTRIICLILAAIIFSAAPAGAQNLPTIEERTKDFDRRDGFYRIYWDEPAAKIWLEIDRFESDFLLVVSQPAGLGSNDIGLDRNQLGESRIVRFERVGPKVLLVAPNLKYRADTENESERTAVRDAFAESIIWNFTVVAETDNRVLVDATGFVVRDAKRVINTLRSTGQGTYKFDPGRSTPWPEMIKAFPKNTEMEARITLTSDRPGELVNTVAADASSLTLRVRQSFVELPGPGYTRRKSDPRDGFNTMSYFDYASPIGSDIQKRFIERHRLEKVNPDSAKSEAVKPIVYYLDPGTPEPVRGALLDGAGWWNEAFEAAGFVNAFRVEMLPEDADPMDVRYNVIHWVHRSTRGWSYGWSLSDPRTGEIIKGNVSLGSLRVRQDYLLAEGLLSPYSAMGDSTDGSDPMLEMALARIRQLSAHEVGHTLGLQHNFAASIKERASVMDYPAPLATFDDRGNIALSDAYDEGIGEWDQFAIRYGYSDFPDSTDSDLALEAILDEYVEQGYRYITDTDARPPGAAHPLANLWDNGADVVSSLNIELDIRSAALRRMGVASVRMGRPLATIEEVLVPLYLHHRFQIDAVAKMIAGVHYSYAVRGDRQELPEAVPARAQRRALQALLATIAPVSLTLPPQLRTSIPPRPPGYEQHRELFGGYTGLIFDPYAPAEIVTGQVLRLIMNPERTARLVNQHDFDTDQPGLGEVLTAVSTRVWESDIPQDPYYAELHRLVQQVWTDALLEAAISTSTSPAARARIVQHLREINIWLEEEETPSRDTETLAHRLLVYDQIDRFLYRPFQPGEKFQGLETPPGQPIGQGGSDFIRRQEHRKSVWDAWTDFTRLCGLGG